MKPEPIEQISPSNRAISDLSTGSLEQEDRPKNKITPRAKPLSHKEMRVEVRRGNYVEGVVALDLGDIIDHDLEGFLDACSTLLTGSELLMDISYKVVGHDGDDTLWLRVSGDASEIVSADDVYYYLEEMVVFSQDEVSAILSTSEQSPWMDQGTNEAVGSGYVLPVKYLDMLPEGVVIPDDITGTRRYGLFIDGLLSDEVLRLFQDILGDQRIWRAWSDSDFALVVPHSDYSNPMDDPLLSQVVQMVPLEEAFSTLEDLKLAFVDVHEGYLIVQNEQKQFETWWMLPDGRGIEQDISELQPVVEYQGDLYRYGNTYLTRAEVYPAIQHEIEK